MVLLTPLKWAFNGSNALGLSFHPTDLYPFAEEHIPDQALKPHNDYALDLTILIDASFASCDATKRSMTAVIAILGSTVVKTHCKR